MPYRRNLDVLWHAAAFLSFPFSWCRSSPSFFFLFCFSFSWLLFFGCRPSCEGRFLFSCTTEEKKEKTSVQGREKSVTDDIPETQFFFVFFFVFLSFLLSSSFPPPSFPWLPSVRRESFLFSSLFVGFFILEKKRKKRRKAGRRTPAHSRICSRRHAERENFTHKRRFHTRMFNSSHLKEKRPEGEFLASRAICHFRRFFEKKEKGRSVPSLLTFSYSYCFRSFALTCLTVFLRSSMLSLPSRTRSVPDLPISCT